MFVFVEVGVPFFIDGTTGEVFAGHVETSLSEVMWILNGNMSVEQSYKYRMFDAVMSWAYK